MTIPALGMRPGIPVIIAGQHGLQQPGTSRRKRRAHRLLQHAKGCPLPQHRRGEPGEPGYLGGGDLLDLVREPPLSPSAGGGAVPAGGRAAQIASLTAVTSSTSPRNR
jgi:hypothetical protein